ncbi:ankyrin and HET domain-containing protein [Colletotrichum scovillei]|uniref:Ankyrin and HET domain-containing protein n=1 Tax=Colletotrichum scovillei TaxID=1209932 RepID=A0A9P7RGW6_9PEZI|nr:ankyrin and HET domain-containing protein [Colletotrichum scovillei]KAG7075327.1 ankyrin and HET domain-containing protein [Colletotrichum scovillei]KAG7082313.1 ankyrin and HET domain-containing protein [Colletotrichum scovillei]
MCYQRIFVHEHCGCEWDKYSNFCGDHDTPGHLVEDWPVPVDKPCDIHPGGTPLLLAYYLRAAELEYLEYCQSSEDTSESSEVQSQEIDADDGRRIHSKNEVPESEESRQRTAHNEWQPTVIPSTDSTSCQIREKSGVRTETLLSEVQFKANLLNGDPQPSLVPEHVGCYGKTESPPPPTAQRGILPGAGCFRAAFSRAREDIKFPGHGETWSGIII